MKKEQEALAKKWANVITKAWTDESFKEKLLRNPALTLKENGISLPAETEIEVHADSKKIIHLVIPQKPSEELSDVELKKVAAGMVQMPAGLGGIRGPVVRWQKSRSSNA